MTAPRPLTPAELAEYQERARDYKTFSPSAGRRLLATIAERDRQIASKTFALRIAREALDGIMYDDDNDEGEERCRVCLKPKGERHIEACWLDVTDTIDRALAAPSDGGGKGGG